MSQPKACEYRKKCGGCQLQNLPYEKQLSHKQVKVIRLLGKYHRVSGIIGMENPYHYRNKVQWAFANRGGVAVSGIYQASKGDILPIKGCMLEDAKADEIMLAVGRLLKSFKLKAFDSETKKGLLRHVLIKRSFSTAQIMVVLVTGTAEFPDAQKFTNALLSRFPEITTVVQNINYSRIRLSLDEESRILYGSGYIEDELLGCRFRISPKAFYQVNPIQTKVLYSNALYLAELDNTKTVIDAYCGTGTIGILAARWAKRVIGVELNGDAVKDAKINAELNGIKNIEFFEADAGEFMIELAARNEKADVVIMDPPRAGASRSFLKALGILAPKRIVYISCNVETQARDLSYLVRRGYKVRHILPVDMFPHTSHVETVVLLSRMESSNNKQI